MTLHDFLVWLASSGGASVALAFITERISAFQSLSPNQKQLVHLGGSLALALAAWAIMTYVPADTLTQLVPAFQIVAGVVGTWIAGQLAHGADPAAKQMADTPAPPTP